MAMHKSWEDARIEGSVEMGANAVLTVLQVRGISVPDAARERILAQKDLEQLTRWLEKASVVSSIAEVFGEAS